MKKLLKLVFSIACFSIMIGIFSLFGTASDGNGTIGSIEVFTDYRPRKVYVSVYTENMGKKIKLEDQNQFRFTVGLRNEEETQKKDVLLRVYGGVASTESVFPEFLPIANERDYSCVDPDPVYVYVNYAKEYSRFRHGKYVNDILYKFYEHGTKDFSHLCAPNKEDSYGRAAQLIDFYIDLSRLAFVEEVTFGAIQANATVGYNLDYYDQGTGDDGISFVTDGEYVLFARSHDAAVSAWNADSSNPIPPLSDEPPAEDPPAEEPRGFWATLADLFDGCD